MLNDVKLFNISANYDNTKLELVLNLQSCAYNPAMGGVQSGLNNEYKLIINYKLNY